MYVLQYLNYCISGYYFVNCMDNSKINCNEKCAFFIGTDLTSSFLRNNK